MIDWDAIPSADVLARKLSLTSNISAVLALTPERFQELFDRVYTGTRSIKSLWQVGGIAANYQRFHNVEIRVPIELARTLLQASRSLDARIVGLKLLARSGVPKESEIVAALLHALERHNEHESIGGIHELTMFLDRRYPNGGLPAPHVVSSLVTALESLARRLAHDPELAAYAARQIERHTNP